MIPQSLFKAGLEAFQDTLTIGPRDRPKIEAWFMQWLANAAIIRTGKWVDQFRPRLVSLAKTIDLKFDSEKSAFKVVCGSADADTLSLLVRGSMWFDGIDQLDAQLVRVISTTNLNSAS